MNKNYRVGLNRGITTLNDGRRDYRATAYLDPQPTKYFNDTSHYFSSLVNMKGMIDDYTFGGEPPVGGTAISLDPAGDYLRTPDSPDWYMGSGDFTYDWWEKRTSFSGSHGTAFCQRSAGNYTGPIVGYTSGSIRYAYMTSNGTSWDIINAFNLGSITLNVWQHIALVRKGNTFYAFLNGVLQRTATSSLTVANSSQNLLLGSDYGSYFINGYLDEMRISKGIARWTSNFLPPSEPYETDEYTVLLVHSNNTAGDTVFEDSSGLGHVITTFGQAKHDIVPFAPGTSRHVGIDYLNYNNNITNQSRDPVIYEGVYFDDNNNILNFKNQASEKEPLHIIFNRCLFVQPSVAQMAIFYDVFNATIEFRHCDFRLSYKEYFYFFRVASSSNTINIEKCVLDVDRLEHHSYIGCAIEDNDYEMFQKRDYVRTPTSGYGPNYGTNLIPTDSPKISGYITKASLPVVRDVHLLNRYGKITDTITSDDEGYYEFDLWHYNMTHVLCMMIEGIEDETSIIIEDLSQVDSRHIEL